MGLRALVFVVTLLSAACSEHDPGVEVDEEVSGEPAAVNGAPIEARRSLVATEQTVLARFTLQRVLDQLVAQSNVPGLTSLALFQQWWDTQNPGPGLGAGPHCDDVIEDGEPVLGGYPYSCRPEGAQARVDPFVDPGTNPNELVPIALVNRFDLTPGDGSNCGEYRIVYARRAGMTDARDRNLIIVEAILDNPHPQQGLKGCRKIVKFWADLSAVADPIERADQLEAFFFDGLPGVAPVVRIEHLGAGPTGRGQVRTNQFMASQTAGLPWSLREFKLQRACTGTSCTALRFVPVPLKNNPWGGLFRSDSTHPQAAAFRTAFIDQVEALAADTIGGLDVDFPIQFNTAQAQASLTGENNYLVQFGSGPSPFRTAIATRLAELGSTLTPDDIVARAQALSCAGCHRLNNGLAIGAGLIFPSALGFVHVSERDTEIVGGEARFVLSDALALEFLPQRERIMRDYLDDKLKKPKKSTDPIGGKRVH